MFWPVLKLTLKTYLKSGADIIYILGVYALIVLLFGYVLAVQPETLVAVSAVIIWITLILASLQSLPALFQTDADEGLLEQWLIGGGALSLIVLAKLVGHWLAVVLPALIVSPLLALFVYYPIEGLSGLCVALVIGSIPMTAIGMLGASLMLSQKGRSALFMLLVLPFYVPVVLFGIAATDAGNGIEAVNSGWGLLLGLCLILTPICIWLTSLQLRHSQ